MTALGPSEAMEDAQQATGGAPAEDGNLSGTKKRPERPAEPRFAFDVISALERLAAPPGRA